VESEENLPLPFEGEGWGEGAIGIKRATVKVARTNLKKPHRHYVAPLQRRGI